MSETEADGFRTAYPPLPGIGKALPDVTRTERRAYHPSELPAHLKEAIANATVPDAVNRPNHYARYLIEPVTFIEANRLPFAVGNVVKYVCRYDAKNGKEDLRKAIRYCEIILEGMERNERIAAGADPTTTWAPTL